MHLQHVTPLLQLNVILGMLPFRLSLKWIRFSGWMLLIVHSLCYVNLVINLANLVLPLALARWILTAVSALYGILGISHGASLIIYSKEWLLFLTEVRKLLHSLPKSTVLRSPTLCTSTLFVCGVMVHSCDLFESLSLGADITYRLYYGTTNLITYSYVICLSVTFGSFLELFNRKLSRNRGKLSRSTPSNISTLADEHLRLYDLIERVSQLYGMQHFFYSVGYFFVCLVHSFFAFYSGNIFQYLALTWQTATFAVIHYWCERSKSEVEKFNNDLFKLVLLNKTLIDQDKLRVLLLMKLKNKFVVWGFFNHGYSFFGGLLLTSTTYITLVIQLGSIFT